MRPQLVDPAEWDRDGGWAPGDRMEWSDRACGIATLRMILPAYDVEAPSLAELPKLGLKHEALTEALDAATVIVSVTEPFPDDGRDPDILLRDPSDWGQAHDRVPLSRLAASHAGRAMTFAPLTTGRTTQ